MEYPARQRNKQPFTSTREPSRILLNANMLQDDVGVDRERCNRVGASALLEWVFSTL